MLLLALLAAAVIDVRADANAIAALPGEPHVVSAAALGDDGPIVTLENGSAFDVSAKRRLVLVGPRDGSATPESAEQVLAAVRWFKTSAPAALRAHWTVSALPSFGNASSTRSLDHWLALQRPDVIVNIGSGSGGWPDAFSSADFTGTDGRAWAAPVRTLAFDDGFSTAVSHLPDQPSALSSGLRARIDRDPLTIARLLAAKYPQQPIISYIPSVAWLNMLRLTAITHEPQWRDKVRDQTAPWVTGGKPLFGAQTPLTSVSGAMIFAEMKDVPRAAALMQQPAALASAVKADGTYANGRGWTDDMFMATAVLVRTGQTPLAVRQLFAYAGRLQRPDGIFMHGTDGPWPWGRGNGFAAFGEMEALAAMQPHDPQRKHVLDLFRRHIAALVKAQAPDGMWNEVIDEPGSYREFTATSMIYAAIARGIRLGWLDRRYAPVADRAWRAIAAHIADDGSVADVCEGTGAGPSKAYYLDRKALTGFDDRGGAMALNAAVEQSQRAVKR